MLKMVLIIHVRSVASTSPPRPRLLQAPWYAISGCTAHPTLCFAISGGGYYNTRVDSASHLLCLRAAFSMSTLTKMTSKGALHFRDLESRANGSATEILEEVQRLQAKGEVVVLLLGKGLESESYIGLYAAVDIAVATSTVRDVSVKI